MLAVSTLGMWRIDFEQAKGFGIYLVKAMLNGKGNEILDLAKTNLRAFV